MQSLSQSAGYIRSPRWGDVGPPMPSGKWYLLGSRPMMARQRIPRRGRKAIETTWVGSAVEQELVEQINAPLTPSQPTRSVPSRPTTP